MLSLPDWKLTLVTNHQISLQGSTRKYPCSAQPQSIPAVPNPSIPQCPSAEYPCNPTAKYPYTAQQQSIPAVPNCKVSSQCPTAKYPCSAQLQSIPAVPNCRVSLQCPTTKYPCSAQPQSIPAVPNRRVSLECPTAESIFSQRICSAARKTVEGGGGGRENVTLLVQQPL